MRSLRSASAFKKASKFSFSVCFFSFFRSPVHRASPPQAVLGPAFTPGTLVALTVPQPRSRGFLLLGLSRFEVFRWSARCVSGSTRAVSSGRPYRDHIFPGNTFDNHPTGRSTSLEFTGKMSQSPARGLNFASLDCIRVLRPPNCEADPVVSDHKYRSKYRRLRASRRCRSSMA